MGGGSETSPQKPRIDVREIIGKKALIYGEAGSGKTRTLAALLEDLKRYVSGEEVTVIDLAPVRMAGVGGVLTDYVDTSGLRYLRPSHVYAPRLMACNAEDLRRYVGHNVEETRRLLQTYLEKPTKHLAVNDVTIFLHGAEVSELLQYMSRAETFIATAYYGVKLEEDLGTGLSRLERERVLELLKHVDVAVLLK